MALEIACNMYLFFNVGKFIFNKHVYDDLINIDDYNRIYVDRWASPSVRYLFEYGEFKTTNKDIYPVKFTFGKLFRHGYSESKYGFFNDKLSVKDYYKTQPNMNDYLDYDLLIAPELFWSDENDKWTLINGTTNFYIQKVNNTNAG